MPNRSRENIVNHGRSAAGRVFAKFDAHRLALNSIGSVSANKKAPRENGARRLTLSREECRH
jgi:hypothetical protein